MRQQSPDTPLQINGIGKCSLGQRIKCFFRGSPSHSHCWVGADFSASLDSCSYEQRSVKNMVQRRVQGILFSSYNSPPRVTKRLLHSKSHSTLLSGSLKQYPIHKSLFCLLIITTTHGTGTCAEPHQLERCVHQKGSFLPVTHRNLRGDATDHRPLSPSTILTKKFNRWQLGRLVQGPL